MFIEVNQSEQRLILKKSYKDRIFKLIGVLLKKKKQPHLFVPPSILFIFMDWNEKWKKGLQEEHFTSICCRNLYYTWKMSVPVLCSYMSKSLIQSNNCKAMSLMEFFFFFFPTGEWVLKRLEESSPDNNPHPFTITTFDYCSKNFTETSS